MYRRYEPPRRQQPQQSQQLQNNRTQPQHTKPQPQNRSNSSPPKHKKTDCVNQQKKDVQEKQAEPLKRKSHLLTEFIPRSVYNPETGKVLGLFSAEDLLLAALILLLIDNGDETSDNSILIYALLYILIEEHIDLPF